MLCHPDHVSSSETIPAIINFLSMSDEGSSPKESGCAVLASLPKFEIVFAASIALTTSVVLHYLASQHQYRIVTSYCVSEILSVKR